MSGNGKQLALPVDPPEAPAQPVRVLDAAEADASWCYTPGCSRSPGFRFTSGLRHRDYCDPCAERVLADQPAPVPYGSFPPGFGAP